MTDLIEGVPEIQRPDVYRLILSLAPGSKYLASDLHRRYVEQCRQAGRQPASPNALGRVLRNVGCERRKLGTAGASRAAWLITGEAVMGSTMGLRDQ